MDLGRDRSWTPCFPCIETLVFCPPPLLPGKSAGDPNLMRLYPTMNCRWSTESCRDIDAKFTDTDSAIGVCRLWISNRDPTSGPGKNWSSWMTGNERWALELQWNSLFGLTTSLWLLTVPLRVEAPWLPEGIPFRSQAYSLPPSTVGIYPLEGPMASLWI